MSHTARPRRRPPPPPPHAPLAAVITSSACAPSHVRPVRGPSGASDESLEARALAAAGALLFGDGLRSGDGGGRAVVVTDGAGVRRSVCGLPLGAGEMVVAVCGRGCEAAVMAVLESVVGGDECGGAAGEVPVVSMFGRERRRRWIGRRPVAEEEGGDDGEEGDDEAPSGEKSEGEDGDDEGEGEVGDGGAWAWMSSFFKGDEGDDASSRGVDTSGSGSGDGDDDSTAHHNPDGDAVVDDDAPDRLSALITGAVDAASASASRSRVRSAPLSDDDRAALVDAVVDGLTPLVFSRDRRGFGGRTSEDDGGDENVSELLFDAASDEGSRSGGLLSPPSLRSSNMCADDLRAAPALRLADAAQLVHALPPNIIMSAIAALMEERRVALVSDSLPTLSRSVLALSELLHPFVWPHILVPTLHRDLLPVLAAPCPYLVGVPTHLLEEAKFELAHDDILFIHLDAPAKIVLGGSLTDPFRRLPRKLRVRLARRFARAAAMPQPETLFLAPEVVRQPSSTDVLVHRRRGVEVRRHTTGAAGLGSSIESGLGDAPPALWQQPPSLTSSLQGGNALPTTPLSSSSISSPQSPTPVQALLLSASNPALTQVVWPAPVMPDRIPTVSTSTTTTTSTAAAARRALSMPGVHASSYLSREQHLQDPAVVIDRGMAKFFAALLSSSHLPPAVPCPDGADSGDVQPYSPPVSSDSVAPVSHEKPASSAHKKFSRREMEHRACVAEFMNTQMYMQWADEAADGPDFTFGVVPIIPAGQRLVMKRAALRGAAGRMLSKRRGSAVDLSALSAVQPLEVEEEECEGFASEPVDGNNSMHPSTSFSDTEVVADRLCEAESNVEAGRGFYASLSESRSHSNLANLALRMNARRRHSEAPTGKKSVWRGAGRHQPAAMSHDTAVLSEPELPNEVGIVEHSLRHSCSVSEGIDTYGNDDLVDDLLYYDRKRYRSDAGKEGLRGRGWGMKRNGGHQSDVEPRVLANSESEGPSMEHGPRMLWSTRLRSRSKNAFIEQPTQPFAFAYHEDGPPFAGGTGVEETDMFPRARKMTFGGRLRKRGSTPALDEETFADLDAAVQAAQGQNDGHEAEKSMGMSMGWWRAQTKKQAHATAEVATPDPASKLPKTRAGFSSYKRQVAESSKSMSAEMEAVLSSSVPLKGVEGRNHNPFYKRGNVIGSMLGRGITPTRQKFTIDRPPPTHKA